MVRRGSPPAPKRRTPACCDALRQRRTGLRSPVLLDAALAKHQAEHKKNREHARRRPEPEGRRPTPSLAARFEKPHGRAIPRFQEIQSDWLPQCRAGVNVTAKAPAQTRRVWEATLHRESSRARGTAYATGVSDDARQGIFLCVQVTLVCIGYTDLRLGRAGRMRHQTASSGWSHGIG